jgi:hypothetical protein
MLKFLYLENVGPAPEVNIGFMPRINLITGDNGLGKSFLLDVAWWALTRRWPHDLNPQLTSGYPAKPIDPGQPAKIAFAVQGKTKDVVSGADYSARDEAWIGMPGRPLMAGLVLYAHSDGGFSVWDPHRNYWKTKGKIDVQERLSGYVFSPREVWDGLEMDVGGKPTIVCNGLLRDWASWIREKGEDAGRMAEALDAMSPPGETLEPDRLVRLSVNDARDIPSLRLPYAEAVPILHASAGVRRIVALCYMLTWAWREHLLASALLGETPTTRLVLLFDELESHLHPRWQRAILGAVLKLAESLNAGAKIQLIGATHSPLILAAAEPLFDPAQDAWFDLDLERSSATEQPIVRLRQRDFVRHGDVSNWLTSEAFDLKSARSLEAESAIERAKALLRQDDPALSEAHEIQQALYRAGLGDIDPFWVRWGAFVEELERRG